MLRAFLHYAVATQSRYFIQQSVKKSVCFNSVALPDMHCKTMYGKSLWGGRCWGGTLWRGACLLSCKALTCISPHICISEGALGHCRFGPMGSMLYRLQTLLQPPWYSMFLCTLFSACTKRYGHHGVCNAGLHVVGLHLSSCKATTIQRPLTVAVEACHSSHTGGKM